MRRLWRVLGAKATELDARTRLKPAAGWDRGALNAALFGHGGVSADAGDDGIFESQA